MGRILQDYGEESNWRSLQNKIVEARSHGGLHSTSDLVDLIKRASRPMKGRSLCSSNFLFVETCSILLLDARSINELVGVEYCLFLGLCTLSLLMTTICRLIHSVALCTQFISVLMTLMCWKPGLY